MLRRAAILPPLLLALGAWMAAPALARAGAPIGPAAPAQGSADPAAVGGAIYQHDCATCHGPTGAGSYQGPAIDRAGQASVDFMISTGRMPPPDAALATQHQPRTYSPEEQQAILAYTATLVRGTPIPSPAADAPVARGGELYRANCAACHQAIGAGGALAYGARAPSLARSTPTQVVEAMRTGPGRMPVFGPDVVGDDDAAAIAAYVQYLRTPHDRGGWGLGHLGPIPEGLLAVVAGVGSLVVVARWLGTRTGSEEAPAGGASGG